MSTPDQEHLFDGAEKEPDKKRRKEPKLLDRFSQAIQDFSLAWRTSRFSRRSALPGVREPCDDELLVGSRR